MPILGKPILTADLCDFIRTWLAANGLRDWRVTEGPDSFKKSPSKEICVSPSPGGGLSQEMHLEALSWQLRVYGPQSKDGSGRSSAEAEEMAWYLDRLMITMEESGMVINGKRINTSQRFGSPPSVMPKDRAGRSNYVTTYVWEVESGL